MVIANIFGVFLFFYLIWWNLKDDYHYEKVFNLGFIGIFFYLISNLVSRFIDPIFWFWVTLLLMSLGFVLVVKKQKMKFFETLEAYFIGLMPWLIFYYLADSIKKSNLSSFIAFWVTLIYVFIYFYLKSHYRSFGWYKSGKVGIAGVLTLIIYFLTRLISSFIYNQTVSFAGRYEYFFSGSVSLLLIILMYNLYKEND